jgi:hypothetical protein
MSIKTTIAMMTLFAGISGSYGFLRLSTIHAARPGTAESSQLTMQAKAMEPTPWYPLKIGNKWYYRVVREQLPGRKKDAPAKDKQEGPAQEVVIEVKELVQIEYMIDGKTEKTPAFRLEGMSTIRTDPKEKPKFEQKLTEHIAVFGDGVYRIAGSDKDVTPPLKILNLPPKDGDSWSESVSLEGSLVKGTFTTRAARISLPGETEPVDTLHVSGDFNDGKQQMTADYWFAPGKGIVKQQIRRGTFTVVLELERFDPK